MLKTLNTVLLKDGRQMTIRRFTPPEKEYAEKFKYFMRHQNDENKRSVGSRAEGKYADCAVDHYFTGEIDGRIAGQVWYGWGCHEQPAANFGQVYVDPDFRGLEITRILMEYLHADFKSSPVTGAFCTCAAPWIANLYQPSGFRQIYPGSPRLYSPGPGAPDDFNDLIKQYYCEVADIRLVPGTMEYRHEIDCLLMFAIETGKIEALRRLDAALAKKYQDAFYGIFNNSGVTMHQLENDYFIKGSPELRKMAVLRCFATSAVTSYQDALFKQEDGRGRIFVALNRSGRCVGWSFCLAPLPDSSTVFLDYELHPDYASSAIKLVAETRKQWYAGENHYLLATCLAESGKMSALADNGFKPIGKIRCPEGGESVLMAD